MPTKNLRIPCRTNPRDDWIEFNVNSDLTEQFMAITGIECDNVSQVDVSKEDVKALRDFLNDVLKE